MTDMITAGLAASAATKALSTLSSALSAARTAKELAKDAKDSELKNALSDVFDKVLDLKDELQQLGDENRALRQQLEEQASVRREGTFGYWFKEGEADPLCPKCYEGNKKLVYLEPKKTSGRSCRICGYYFSEDNRPFDLKVSWQ